MIIDQFGGIIPRKPWHALQGGEATIAHDVKLRNGKIEAWRERENISLGVTDALTLFTTGCDHFTWSSCVSATDYLSDWGRLFLTGNADRPQTAIKEDGLLTYYYLGVPAPTDSPRVNTTTLPGDRDTANRSYMYTYVNKFGEESAPSPPSATYRVKDGQSVIISGFNPPPADYGIVQIHIYRTATAHRNEHEKEQNPLTDFLKVAEIDVDTVSYTDTMLERDLGPVNNTREVRVPPATLRHLKHIQGNGQLCGVTTNQIHFSGAYQPHNWPAEYDITLPHNIVNMVTQSGKVYVTTTSHAYVLDGTYNCEARRCRSVDDVDIPLPDIGCGYAHSAIPTPFGMVYSSKDGLVLVQPNATFQILTSKWFSTDDWVKVRPDTVRLAYWRGYLICVTDMIAFMLEIDSAPYNDIALGALVTLSDRPVDMESTKFGELLMLEPNAIISQWNTGSSLRPYNWISREIPMGNNATPVSARVKMSGGTAKFHVYTPHELTTFERQLSNEEAFRVRRLGRHIRYRIGFTGIGTIELVEFGTKCAELQGGV